MSNHEPEGKPQATRRTALKAGLALAALPMAGLTAHLVRAQGRNVTKVMDFETAADVGKAEQEGALLFYTNDSENAGAALMAEFEVQCSRESIRTTFGLLQQEKNNSDLHLNLCVSAPVRRARRHRTCTSMRCRAKSFSVPEILHEYFLCIKKCR